MSQQPWENINQEIRGDQYVTTSRLRVPEGGWIYKYQVGKMTGDWQGNEKHEIYAVSMCFVPEAKAL